MNQRKGSITMETVPGIAITLVVIAVVLGVGAEVVDSYHANTCEAGFSYNATSQNCHDDTNVTIIGGEGYAFNATTQGLLALDELASWQDTWAVVLALAIIIGVLGFLYFRK